MTRWLVAMAVTAAAFQSPSAAADESVPGEPGVDDPNFAERLDEFEQEARGLAARVQFLVQQYGQDGELLIEEVERRFSDAEIHFLLENYAAAIVLLYDIVDSPRFKASDRYDDALYYLAESLYRQESYLPARGFFLEIVRRGSPQRHDDAMLRLIQISGRLGDFEEVEAYYQHFVQSGRSVRPELQYVWGKVLFERDDIDDSERWARALQTFDQVPLEGPYGLAARYWVGVVHTQRARKSWERAQVRYRADFSALERAEEEMFEELRMATDAFRDVVDATEPDERGRRVQEQAWLALGRVFIERESYAEAIDAYLNIDRHSEHYFQSLYEVAWAFVRRGDLENARRAAEVLLTGAADSVLAPEIRLLLGHLYARAERYEDASEAYEGVIVEYSPVHDDLEDLLTRHDDPVSHFSELIAADEGGFDVEDLLPREAVMWASTQQEIDQGLGIVSSLESSRTGIEDGRQIAERIMASLDGGTLEPFPTLAEGHRRGNQAQADILGFQNRLGDLEHAMLARFVPSELEEEYEEARRRREEAAARLQSMPATVEELEQQQDQRLRRIDALKREAFRARMEAQSQRAQVVAMRRHIRDNVDEIAAEPGEVEAFLSRLEGKKKKAEALEAESSSLKRELDRVADAVRAGTALEGAKAVVEAYEDALAKERSVASRVGDLSETKQDLLRNLEVIRSGVIEDGGRVVRLLDDIERRGSQRRQVLRDQVSKELARLEEYESDVRYVGESTRDLVGRIAFESVGAIRRHFYDLVLRSDVGIIDVAWAEKSSQSTRIQEMVEEQDQELQDLDRRFREVLRNPDEELER